MLLAKSCMKDYNIKHGTIKLGTLHEYKTTELKHIADPQEGYLKFKLKFDGTVEVEPKWFNALAGRAIQIGHEAPIRYPGKTNAQFKIMNIVRADAGKIILKNSEAIIERESLNGFVYCMSQVRKTRDCKNIFPEYDDYWFISEIKAMQFGVTLGGILRNAIIAGRASGKHLVPESMSIENFSVNIEMGLVQYIPREIHVSDGETFKLDDFMNKMASIAFIKPPIPFAKEREYRFNYTIISDNKIIEPSVKYTILDSTPLQDLVMQIDLTDQPIITA